MEKMFTEFDAQESCLVIVKDIINFRHEVFTLFHDFMIISKMKLEKQISFFVGKEATSYFCHDKREIDTDIFPLPFFKFFLFHSNAKDNFFCSFFIFLRNEKKQTRVWYFFAYFFLLMKLIRVKIFYLSTITIFVWLWFKTNIFEDY